MIWVPSTNQHTEVFSINPITFTVMPQGTDHPITINLTDLLARLQTVPDQRKRRRVRYPLAVLLAIAGLAKLCGQSQIHALAGWAHEQAAELASGFDLRRLRMPYPTTSTRVLGHAVASTALDGAVQSLLQSSCSHEVPALGQSADCP